MLYGVNSRERDRTGFIAEKNRFAPWSGAAMQGRLDCSADGRELTITRETKRQTAPMGEFRAVYAGTGDAVPGLTGQNCGEALLGVPREVFERSAFIRQSGLAVSANAELEKRIVSLITSGEEDTSYTEAEAALRKQLNRRRHNKTGQLPALESQLAQTQQQLSELRALSAQLAQTRAQAEALAQREQLLAEELAAHGRYEAVQKRQALAQAEAAAQQAEARSAGLRRALEEGRVPSNEAIARLRGAIVNLETVRRSVDKARAERDEAMKAVLRAEAAVSESPFAGQTAEEARREAVTPPKVQHWRKAPVLLALLAGLLLAAGASFALFRYTRHPLGGILGAAVPAILAVWAAAALRRKSLSAAQSAALQKRFGTADPAAVAALADTYIKLLEDRDAAQADANAKAATADALYASLTSNEQGILLEVRRFAPAAFDIPAADAALRQCAQQRRALQEAETAAREARMRWELSAQQLPPEEPDGAAEPPARSRDAVTAELSAARAQLAEARSAADRLTGQLHAGGDPAVLQSQAEALTGQIAALEREYAAIALAMETLEGANNALQNRFSPALGRKAAEIFCRLTGGRYTGVVLDRDFHLSAEPAGDSVYRDAQLLSAGAADQLYLAVRLAICQTVLPQEAAVPLILDDALANFDGARCAAALDYLRAEAEHRQILLFTCHDREAAFFRGDEAVSVQRLGAAAPA